MGKGNKLKRAVKRERGAALKPRLVTFLIETVPSHGRLSDNPKTDTGMLVGIHMSTESYDRRWYALIVTKNSQYITKPLDEITDVENGIFDMLKETFSDD